MRVGSSFDWMLSIAATSFPVPLGDVKTGMLEEDARFVAIGLLSPQVTAFFTSAVIPAASAAVNSISGRLPATGRLSEGSSAFLFLSVLRFGLPLRRNHGQLESQLDRTAFPGGQ
jgi:hypothetical protein